MRNSKNTPRRFSHVLIGVAACAALWSGCATPPKATTAPRDPRWPSTATLEQQLQPRLADFVARSGVPGATVAFALPDGRTGAVAAGISNKSTNAPMQPDDRMLAGSIGKTYVSALLLQLHEMGRVDLDQKIAHWFANEPWFARLPNANDITLRILMNHTSGIPEHVVMPAMLAALKADPYKVWRPEELLAFDLDQPPLFPAGKGWSYADTNYILVGMIIERIVGRPYYDELTDRILKPCNLHDTIPSDRPQLPGLISGYTTPDNPFPVPLEVVTNGRCAFNPQMEWTGGGLLSTSRDLARWAQMLYGGHVLNDASKALLLHAVPAPPLGVNQLYGLGVMIRPSEFGPVYGHAGWFPGYVSDMAYYADHGFALAVQINTDEGRSRATMDALLDECAALLAYDTHGAATTP